MARPTKIEIPPGSVANVSDSKLATQIVSLQGRIDSLARQASGFHEENGEIIFSTKPEITTAKGLLEEARDQLAILLAIQRTLPAAPHVISTVPKDGATNVSLTTTITVTFSHQIDPTTLR